MWNKIVEEKRGTWNENRNIYNYNVESFVAEENRSDNWPAKKEWLSSEDK